MTLSRGHRVPIDRCLPSIFTIIVKASERRTVNGQCEVRGNEQRILESTLNLQHALTLLSVQQTGLEEVQLNVGSAANQLPSSG